MRSRSFTAAGRFFVACTLCIGTARAADIAIGRSVQRLNFDASARVSYFSAELISEGVQMHGIPNRNRVINLDVVMAHRWGRWEPYIKAGVSCSRYGFNGSGNGYRNATGFTGQNLGVGVDYLMSAHWAVRAQTVWMRYQQVDIPAFETYSYTSVSLVFRF
ncbi:MAG: hypothetical protein B7Z80_12580 [Rhodospirillales bacterium 20-64-7]|nr:MAG: hypothetical protein B7Z80_12580 [Rhodospirillales bacterium 20-64-7]